VALRLSGIHGDRPHCQHRSQRRGASRAFPERRGDSASSSVPGRSNSITAGQVPGSPSVGSAAWHHGAARALHREWR